MTLMIRSHCLAMSQAGYGTQCETPPHTHTHSLAAGMPVILPKGPNDESLDWGVKWTKLAKNALFEDLDCDNYCHYQGGDLKKDAIAIVQL